MIGFHLRQLDAARRIIGAESLGYRKVEHVAERLEPVAGRSGLLAIKHVLDEPQRQRCDLLVAVFGAKAF